MDILSAIPFPALIFLGILFILIILGVIFLSRRNKKPVANDMQNPPSFQETIPVQPAMEPPPVSFPFPPVQPLTQPLSQPTETPVANISTTPVKSNEGKFLGLILAGAAFAVLLPLTAVLIVKNQSVKNQLTQDQTVQNEKESTCNAVTITDTLDNSLSDEALSALRPRDEVKILISSSGNNSIDKARFRVNGSTWQEVTIREKNNFVANYILEDNTKKFTVEAEIHDSVNGWK